MFSEAASISKWVKGEINVAFTEDKPILPFRVDETEIKGGFRLMLNQMHWIDAFPHYADRLPDLLSSICGLLGRYPQKAKAESSSTQNGLSNSNQNTSMVSVDFMICPEGAINGVFSVSPTKKVYFSKGNLQYQASTNTWRFAENQYGIIGKLNKNISPNKNGWMDLFVWGTGNNPTKIISETNDCYPYDFADWGDNRIDNGGNKEKFWITLTKEEWLFLFNRPVVMNYAKANVGGINGVILFPDNWNNTSEIGFVNVNQMSASYYSNTVSICQWQILERFGVVFLPAGGCSETLSVYLVGSSGFYWSASPSIKNKDTYECDSFHFSACAIGFSDDFHVIDEAVRYGKSVRLVCAAN